MKKLSLLFLSLFFVLSLSSCNAINSVNDNLSEEGYTLYSLPREVVDGYKQRDEDLSGLKYVHMIVSDTGHQVGTIYEFSSKSSAKDYEESRGAGTSFSREFVYKNLFVMTMYDNVAEVIQGS